MNNKNLQILNIVYSFVRIVPKRKITLLLRKRVKPCTERREKSALGRVCGLISRKPICFQTNPLWGMFLVKSTSEIREKSFFQTAKVDNFLKQKIKAIK